MFVTYNVIAVNDFTLDDVKRLKIRLDKWA